MLAYPSFDIRNVTNSIGIIRAGQVYEKRAHLAKYTWEIDGSARNIAFGEPDGPQAVLHLSVADRQCIQEAADEVQSLLIADDSPTPEGTEAARDRPFLRAILEAFLAALMKSLIPFPTA